MEAVHDSSAGLTYTALSGTRKQSVEDVKRLFSKSLIKWMDIVLKPSILKYFVIGDRHVMNEGWQTNSTASSMKIFSTTSLMTRCHGTENHLIEISVSLKSTSINTYYDTNSCYCFIAQKHRRCARV